VFLQNGVAFVNLQTFVYLASLSVSGAMPISLKVTA